MKDLIQISLEEFQAMKEFGQDELFNEVVIVPTDDIHDSGYRCMKFVLCRKGKIVGCVGGYSDVIHPNWFRPIPTMNIDCLPVSGCVRLIFRNVCRCEDFIGSDFCFNLGERI